MTRRNNLAGLRLVQPENQPVTQWDIDTLCPLELNNRFDIGGGDFMTGKRVKQPEVGVEYILESKKKRHYDRLLTSRFYYTSVASQEDVLSFLTRDTMDHPNLVRDHDPSIFVSEFQAIIARYTAAGYCPTHLVFGDYEPSLYMPINPNGWLMPNIQNYNVSHFG